MDKEKKPTATVKANFLIRAAEETAKAERAQAKAPGDAARPAPSGRTKSEAARAASEVFVQKEVNTMAVKKTQTTETESKTAETKKASTAKKTTAARKTTTAKKTAVKQPEVEVTLQWNGNEYSTARLLQSAKDVWQYDLGRNADEIKSVQIYAKPEEGKAYVVVNGTDTLSFDI